MRAEEVENPMYGTYPGGIDELRKDICREFENIKATGKAWPWAPTWDEAIATIRESHGDETAEDRELESLS